MGSVLLNRFQRPRPLPGHRQTYGLTTDIDPTLVPQLNVLAQAHNTPIFPCLQALKVSVWHESSAGTIVALLHPTLTQVNLMIHHVGHESLLPIILRLRVCIKLERFALRLDPSSYPVHLIESALVEGLNPASLVTMTLPLSLLLRPRVWEFLQGVDNLNSIYCPPFELDVDSLQGMEPHFAEGWSNLVDLTISIPYSASLSLFKDTAPPKLKALCMNIHRRLHDTESWSILTDLLCARIRDLETFVLTSPSPVPISFRDLSHCLQWKSLRDLAIYTEGAAILTDSDFCTLASSMTGLVHLSISPRPSNSMDIPPCTLRALSHMAQYCRSLEHLDLRLDTGFVCNSTNPSDYAVFSTTLRILNFGLSKAHDPVMIGSLLAG